MNEEQSAPFYAVKKKGSLETLSFLFDAWCRWKKGGKKSPASTNKCISKGVHLSKGTKLSTRTFNLALKALGDLRLVEKEGKYYYLSDLGLFMCPMLESIRTVPVKKRSLTPFSEKEDERSWIRETSRMIIGTKKQLYITTRRLSSFEKKKEEEDLSSAFEHAAGREVEIKIIADFSISKRTQDIFTKKYGAHLRFLPSSILENPPNVLKPIFLQDFAHVMISDRVHWLYLDPHELGEPHCGKCTTDDPTIADHLADVFEGFWAFAEPKQ